MYVNKGLNLDFWLQYKNPTHYIYETFVGVDILLGKFTLFTTRTKHWARVKPKKLIKYLLVFNDGKNKYDRRIESIYPLLNLLPITDLLNM